MSAGVYRGRAVRAYLDWAPECCDYLDTCAHLTSCIAQSCHWRNSLPPRHMNAPLAVSSSSALDRTCRQVYCPSCGKRVGRGPDLISFVELTLQSCLSRKESLRVLAGASFLTRSTHPRLHHRPAERRQKKARPSDVLAVPPKSRARHSSRLIHPPASNHEILFDHQAPLDASIIHRARNGNQVGRNLLLFATLV